MCFLFAHHLLQAQTSYISGITYIGGYHLKCNGQSTASIKANPSFGTPPYTFLWNTGETTPELLNKPAGIYSVIMTDSNQVTHADTFEVKQPYVLGYESTLTDYFGFNIDAHGAHTGGIVLNATGGTPPYRYTWNTGDSIANLRELAAGAYSFVITDANHCSTSGNITLTEPNAIQVSFSNIENLTCFSSDDGKATLSVNGGLGDFSVVWDNGSFSLSPEDLHAGFNAVRIFEQGNAVLDTGITLTQPNKIDIQFSMSNYNGYGVSCVDCFNGTIASTVTGGTAPYTYAWDDVNNSTTAGLSNLNGDKYTLTVIDANGCKAVNTALLTMPKPKDWSRFGNANIDTSMFIGSTDTSAVRIRSNNTDLLRLMGNGTIEIPTYSGAELLAVDNAGKLEKVENLKERTLRPGPNDCYNFSPAPGFMPTPTWTAEPGKIYTCPNVGIGTNNPIQALEVNGVTRTNLLWVTPNATFTATNHSFYVEGESLLQGNTFLEGRVSIGSPQGSNNYLSQNADYKLCVNGKILATEVLVKERNNWPDYVFQKNYKLKSLKDVNSFIIKNGHLPEVPSAKEIETNGINTGEMLNLQMKKIEELTLYIIDLQKQVDELKQSKK